MTHDHFLSDDKNTVLANETKFSPIIETERLDKIITTVYADQAGTYQLWGKNSLKPEETLRQLDTDAYPASQAVSYEITPSFKHLQIRFVNGASNTSTHEVTYRLVTKLTIKPVSRQTFRSE